MPEFSFASAGGGGRYAQWYLDAVGWVASLQPLGFELVQGMLLLAIAAQIGALLQRAGSVPAVTGYIAAGLLLGPHAAGLLSRGALTRWRLAADAGLACIGFAAGLELAFPRLRQNLRPVLSTVSAVVPLVWILCFLAALRVLPALPGPPAVRTAAAGISAWVLCARSPASAIAVVREQDASGPFTTLVVCSSVAIDATVVSLFGPVLRVAGSVAGGEGLTLAAVAVPVAGLAASIVVGIALWQVLASCGPMHVRAPQGRGALILVCGCLVSVAADWLPLTGCPVHIDAIVVCAAAGACAANSEGAAAPDSAGAAFEHAVHLVLPVTNVAFFSLVGASIRTDSLRSAAVAAPWLVAARLAALVAGTSLAPRGAVPQEAPRWAGFVTQAGVAIALCGVVGRTFPGWGPPVEATLVAAILCNLIAGPPLFKWALVRAGEANSSDQVLAAAVWAPPPPSLRPHQSPQKVSSPRAGSAPGAPPEEALLSSPDQH